MNSIDGSIESGSAVRAGSTGAAAAGGPLDHGLRVFLAAADAGSFSAAARALDVGQPAVSHQIAKLEAEVGASLFHRSTAGVQLTGAGAALRKLVAPAFGAIDGAIEELRSTGRPETVTLSVSTSLASFWLMPRLPAFKLAHPTVELRVMTCDSDAGIGRDDADLWVPLGAVDETFLDRRGLEAVFMCAERICPVAAPPLAARVLNGEIALRDAPLIELEERYAPRFDWAAWFARDGSAPTSVDAAYASNDYQLVLQTALDGQGVALGWMHIVDDLIAAGRLVALDEPVVTDRPFDVLTSTHRPKPDAIALRTWLCAEMAMTAAPT